VAITQQDKSLHNTIFEPAHPQTAGNEKHELELLNLDPEMLKMHLTLNTKLSTNTFLNVFFKHAYVYPSHHISHSWQYMTLIQTVGCCGNCST